MRRSIHKRNIRFKNEVAKADKKRILGVAVDTSKTFHRVVIFNFLGKTIIKPFSIDTLLCGYEELKHQIGMAQKRIKAVKTYIALETPAKYTENLVQHLRNDFGNVVFVPPYEVSQNRKQRTFHGLKTDDIDAGSVGDMLIRGEFSYVNDDEEIYKKLNSLVHWREQKITIRTMIKAQIGHRFARIFPGLNTTYGGRKPVFQHEYESLIHSGLLKLNKTPLEILKMTDNELYEYFGYGLYQKGRYYIKRLRERINEMLLLDEETIKTDIEFLRKDYDLLRYFDGAIENIEKEIIETGTKTEAKYLFSQIKGLSNLTACIYIGLTGSLSKFKTAGHVYSYAGLSPQKYQSGTMKLEKIGIKRYGSKLLRSVLFRIATSVIMDDPYFVAYHRRIKMQKNKTWKELRIIICRKLNNIIFALIRDKSNFKYKAAANSLIKS